LRRGEQDGLIWLEGLLAGREDGVLGRGDEPKTGSMDVFPPSLPRLERDVVPPLG
jgi:hypothetical protein